MRNIIKRSIQVAKKVPIIKKVREIILNKLSLKNSFG